MNSALGTRVGVDHWDNAIRQGNPAGPLTLGEDATNEWQPYFCTDQFDLGMADMGRGGRDDDVVFRDSEQSGEFIAFWQRKIGR